MAARSLANIFNKGLATFPAATSTASVSFYQSILRLSTAVPNDPDTREDFRPSDKIQNSGPSLNEIVEKVNSLLVTPDAYFGRQRKYMKGMPEYPQCGFSVLAVKVLREYKFAGGSDIILSLHQNGKLKEKMKDVNKQQNSE